MVEYNPFEPDLPTNNPRAHYAVTEAVLPVIQRYGTEHWRSAVDRFRDQQGALVERYARARDRMMVAVRVPEGWKLRLSPGRHNELQRAVVEEFAPRFAPGANLLTSATQATRTCLLTGHVLHGSYSHDRPRQIARHRAGRR